MTALFVLVPISLGMGIIGLGAFFWALRHDQFDDPDGNAWRPIVLPDATGPARAPVAPAKAIDPQQAEPD